MCLRIIDSQGFADLGVVNDAVQPAEQYRGFVHVCCHRLAAHGKGFEGDVKGGDTSLKIKGAVKAFGCALNVDFRELVDFAVREKTVFVAEAVVTDPACEAEGKPLSVNHTVRAEPLIVVVTGLGKARPVKVGARCIFV